MCTSNISGQTPSAPSCQESNHLQGLYSHLSNFFSTTDGSDPQQIPTSLYHLMQLMGLIENQPQNQPPPPDSQQSSAPPTPTSHRTGPPPHPTPLWNGPPPPSSTSHMTGPPPHSSPEWTNPPPPPHTCCCQPNHLTSLILKLVQFSATFTRTARTAGTVLFLLLAVSLVPSFFLHTALYLMLASSLNMPMPTLLAGHLIYSTIFLMNPTLLVFLVLWATYKIFIKKQKIIDTDYWKEIIAGINGHVHYN